MKSEISEKDIDISMNASILCSNYYSSAVKKWGNNRIWVVCHSVRLSVIISFPLNILRTSL